MSDYVTEFVEESQEQITELNNRLLELERSPDDEEAMDAIFRIAHTLKGNCGAMGLSRASDLAHAIEDLLDAVRAGTVEVSPELMDSVFAGVDELETMVEEVATHGEVRTDPTPTIETLRATLEDGASLPTPTDEEIDAVLEDVEPPAASHSAYLVRLAIDGDDGHSGSLVVAALVDAFELLATDPSRERIEAGEYGDSLDAVFGTPVGEAAIAAALDPVDVVAEFEIVDVTDRFETLESESGDDELSTADASEMEVDELLDEFNEFDDLDKMVEEVEDVSAFEDMGEAGSFDDLLGDEDDLEPDLEPGVPTVDEESTETDADETSAAETDADETVPVDDDESEDEIDGDANAVFNELKDEVEQVEFDELQEELDELEFDEYDEEEVGMDELLGEDVDDDEPFLADEPGDDEIDELLVEPDAGVDDAEPISEEADAESPSADDAEPEPEPEPEPSPTAETEPSPDEAADEIFAKMDPSADDDDPDVLEADDDPDVLEADDDPDVLEADDDDDTEETEATWERDSDEESAGGMFQFGDVETADAEDDTDTAEPTAAEDDTDTAEPTAAEDDTDTAEPTAAETGDATAAEADATDVDDDTLETAAEADWETEPSGQAFDDDEDASFADPSEDETAFGTAESDDDLATDVTSFSDPDSPLETDPSMADDAGFTEPDSDDAGFTEPDSDDAALDAGLGDDGVDDELEATGPDLGTGSLEETGIDETAFDTGGDDLDTGAAAVDTGTGDRDTGTGDLGIGATETSDEGPAGPTSPEVGDTGQAPPELPDVSVPDVEETSTAETEEEPGRTQQSVRVGAEQIDSLLNLVEGLVTSRVRLRHAIESDADLKTIDRELDDLEDLTAELQETVMNVRLVPIETVTNRLPRVVRDIAREQDKEVSFEIEGESVELDRGILDRLDDPLIHMVRNAVDHGIEPPDEREASGKPREGAVELRAERSRDRVTIEIEDDGSGLDPDRLRSEAVEAGVVTEAEAEALSDDEAHDLVFHSGLSTAEEVTDVSGRGVGMDVVRQTIDDLGGAVSVESEPGEGTTFTLTLPVTVAITDVLFVESGGETFGIPSKAIADVETTTVLDIDEEAGTLEMDDEELPILDLAAELDTPEPSDDDDGMIVRAREAVRPVALRCDEIRGQQEVVVKPFEGFMADIPGLSGATVRGRGEVVNILDVKTL